MVCRNVQWQHFFRWLGWESPFSNTFSFSNIFYHLFVLVKCRFGQTECGVKVKSMHLWFILTDVLSIMYCFIKVCCYVHSWSAWWLVIAETPCWSPLLSPASIHRASTNLGLSLIWFVHRVLTPSCLISHCKTSISVMCSSAAASLSLLWQFSVSHSHTGAHIQPPTSPCPCLSSVFEWWYYKIASHNVVWGQRREQRLGSSPSRALLFYPMPWHTVQAGVI